MQIIINNNNIYLTFNVQCAYYRLILRTSSIKGTTTMITLLQSRISLSVNKVNDSASGLQYPTPLENNNPGSHYR